MKKKQSLYKTNNWFDMIPLAIILVLVPIVVYAKVTKLDGYLYENWIGATENVDFFGYWKSVIFIISTIFAMGILAGKLYFGKIIKLKTHTYSILLLLYAIFIFLSSIFSKYPEEAFWGIFDKKEGMFVLLSYCFICYYSYKTINSIFKAKIILKSLLLSSSVVFIIGISQYLGYDFFKSSFGQKIILGELFKPGKDNLTYRVGMNAIYSTLSHYNYVGTFVSIVIPLLTVLTFFIKNKKLKSFIICILVLGCLVWLNCFSRSAFLNISFAFFVGIALFVKKIIKYRRPVAIYASIFLIIIAGLGFFSKTALIYRFSTTLLEINSIRNNHTPIENNFAQVPLRDLKVSGSEATLVTDRETLTVKLSKSGNLLIEDEQKKPLIYSFNKSNGLIELQNKDYSDYVLKAGKLGLKKEKDFINIKYKNLDVFIDITTDSFLLINNLGKKIEFEPIEKWGFNGAENFASRRGYIWSRSIPLIKNTIFTGYGPDNFIFYFPQNDIKGKLMVHGDMWHIDDKPHNLYLQIALNTGDISLLVVMLLLGAYFFNSFRLYFDCDITKESNYWGVAFFLSVCGYIASGLFNDSVVYVAPVFWIILGTGIALNEMSSRVSLEQ